MFRTHWATDGIIKNLREEAEKTYTEYELTAIFDKYKSFHGKAKVRLYKDGRKELISYTTHVATIANGVATVNGTYSTTTLRHLIEFLNQDSFTVTTKAQVELLANTGNEQRVAC